MIDGRSDGWLWFEARQSETPSAISDAFQQCFATPAGRRVLEHLRETYLERRLGPESSDAMLRYFEGARMVAAYIERQAFECDRASSTLPADSIK